MGGHFLSALPIASAMRTHSYLPVNRCGGQVRTQPLFSASIDAESVDYCSNDGNIVNEIPNIFASLSVT